MSKDNDPNRQLFDESLGQAPGRGRLAGRRILVVGGGQRSIDDPYPPIGNGRAICQLAAREGASVVCLDSNRQAAEDVCAAIRSTGGIAWPAVADVSDADTIGPSVDRSIEFLGGLDGLVCNVGITSGIPLAKLTPKAWDFDFAVNLRSHMLYCQKALEVMPDGSSIVLISSIAAWRPTVNQPSYEVSKAGIIPLAGSVAKAGEPSGIRCNAILPGLIDTPLGRHEGRRRTERARVVPLGRQGTGWDIAYPTIFLLSHEAAYINAQALTVDGGYHKGIVRATT